MTVGEGEGLHVKAKGDITPPTPASAVMDNVRKAIPDEASAMSSSPSTSYNGNITNTTRTHYNSNDVIKARRWMIVPTSAAQAIQNYRYSGKDLSLLYKYVLSPFAERCLAITPLWLAPNLITFLGLLISILGAVTFCICCPDWQSDNAPRWLFPFMGICLLVYQTLDNLDGKQARRTGTGSALGLLFDHGCDAINATFGTFILLALTGPGYHLPSVAFCFGNNVIPFYFATWEHYYTEILILPIINGPSEGVIIGVVLAFISFFTGSAIWQTPTPIPAAVPFVGRSIVPLWVVLMSGSYIGIVLTCVQQTVTVLRLRIKQNKSLLKPLLDLVPLVIVTICGALWLVHATDIHSAINGGGSGSSSLLGDVSRKLAVNGGGGRGGGGGGIVDRMGDLSISELFSLYPYQVLCLFGSLMGESIIALMLAHMMHEPFQPFRLILAPLVFAVMNGCVLEKPLVSNEMVLHIYSAVAVAWLAVYVMTMVIDIRDHLNIYVFSTKKRTKVA